MGKGCLLYFYLLLIFFFKEREQTSNLVGLLFQTNDVPAFESIQAMAGSSSKKSSDVGCICLVHSLTYGMC